MPASILCIAGDEDGPEEPEAPLGEELDISVEVGAALVELAELVTVLSGSAFTLEDTTEAASPAK